MSNDAVEVVRMLDRLAWSAREQGDHEMADWAEREREKALLRIPMAVKVNAETGEAISPSGLFDDHALEQLERLRRDSLFTYEALRDIEEFIAQAGDSDDDPPSEEPPPAA